MKILRLLPAVIFVFAASFTFAQQRGVSFLADKAYESGDYYDAINLYKKAFTKEKNKAKKGELLFKVGECYRLVNDTKNQEVWFAKAVKANPKNAQATLNL